MLMKNQKNRQKHFGKALMWLACVLTVTAAAAGSGASVPPTPPEQAIFPGQCSPRISHDIIEAYDHALKRDYDTAREIVLKLGRDIPQDPAGPTGEMVLYQVMMLENEDYQYDAQFRDAARRADEACKFFSENAKRNDWYFTILGASNGIQGIYFLRRSEYFDAFMPGLRGLQYMQTASKMDENNWEARMGIGLFLYYRSAFASLVPGAWEDQRKKGIEEVELAGKNRAYLNEVSRIALYYIYVNEKNFDKAKEYMDALIAERPYFVIFYQLAGRAMIEKGDLDAAYDYFDKMREIDPTLYLPYFKLGEISMKRHRKKEARKWFEEFFNVLGDRESVHRKPAEKYMKQLK